MLLRTDYPRFLLRIEELRDFDPFGEFILKFGPSLRNLKLRGWPEPYKDHPKPEPCSLGRMVPPKAKTNFSRFRHGWLLNRTRSGLWNLRFPQLRA